MDWIVPVALALTVLGPAGHLILHVNKVKEMERARPLEKPKRTMIDARRAQAFWFDKPWTDGVPKPARLPSPPLQSVEQVERSIRYGQQMLDQKWLVEVKEGANPPPSHMTRAEIEMRTKMYELQMKQREMAARVRFEEEKKLAENNRVRLMMLRATRADLAKRVAYGKREDQIELQPQLDEVNRAISKLENVKRVPW